MREGQNQSAPPVVSCHPLHVAQVPVVAAASQSGRSSRLMATQDELIVLTDAPLAWVVISDPQHATR